jgi:hypothetical protein
MFVLVSKPSPFSETMKEYYIGKTYRVHGGIYPLVVDTTEAAKNYKSEKVANNACEKLNEKLDFQEFSVEEI